MISIRPEEIEDIPAIHALNAAAFEAEFGSTAEAGLVDALRDADAHVVSLVAVDDGAVVGHILFSPVTIESNGDVFDAIGLAPMSAMPGRQREGIGSRLVEEGLARCAALGHEICVVLGHPEYYPRFGFRPSVEFGITSEYDVPPEVFMVKELRPGALKGRSGLAKYHPAFAGV